MEFQGKVVLVTGSAQGIGLATVREFAREGATLVLNDLNREALDGAVHGLESEGTRCMGVAADTSKKVEVDRMIEKTMEAFGKLDVLVNNAGITRDALLHKMTEEQWTQVINVNLTGVFFCLQAAAKIMRDAKSGSIINISSDARYGNTGQANYSAAKEGIIGLTRTAAKELAPRKVRVNAVSPGPIDTPMLRAAPEKAVQAFLASIPLGRAGSVEEVSRVILFLASERSSYITGQVINCDGGWMMQ